MNFLYFQKFFILESTWRSTDSLDLSIIKGNEQFKGKIQFELFQKISTSLEIEYEIFFNETKNAITTNNGVAEFSYFINEEEFIWKKNSSEKLKIIYGKACLEKCETIQNILFNSVDIISNLKSQLDDYKKDQVTGMVKLNELNKLLEQATEFKEENEKEIYLKFICLLNAKKAKINDLKQSGRRRLPSPDNSSDEDNLNKTVIERNATKSSDSSEDSSMIPILPKRRKFLPVIKVIKPAEKEIEVVSSQKSSADSEDLFKDM